MIHIDLFSGIGGFALGFGTQPLAFCEIDPGCRVVLEKHWPETPIYRDVSSNSELPVSGLVGSWQEVRPRGLAELLRELSRWWSREGRQVADELARSWDSAPRRLGTDDGIPGAVDRRHALGNAVVINAVRLVARSIESV